MFKVNDVVVYRRDVCRIIDKKRSDFTGEVCYILVPYDNENSSVVMQVPVSNKGGHLRNLVTREEIVQLIKDAPSVETLESKPANMKSQYVTLMKSDSIVDLIRIIKTSYLRNHERLMNHKKLASIDSEYLNRAEKLLYTELSIALDMPYEDCKKSFEEEIQKVASEAEA